MSPKRAAVHPVVSHPGKWTGEWCNASAAGEDVTSQPVHARNYVHYKASGNDGSRQGDALLYIDKVETMRWARGILLTGRHVAATDKSYQRWAALGNRGQPECLRKHRYYHLCAKSHTDCTYRPAGGQREPEMIHISRWRVVSERDAASLLAEWRQDHRQLPAKLSDVIDVQPRPQTGGSRRSAAGAAAPVGRGRVRPREPSPQEAAAVRSARTRRVEDSGGEDQRDDQRPIRKKDTSLEPELAEVTRAGKDERDEVLQERLQELKSRLNASFGVGSGSAPKRPSPEDILLDRAKARASKAAAAPPQRKRPVVTKPVSSLKEDLGIGGDLLLSSEDELGTSSRISLGARRAAFHKVAKTQPGRLAIKGLDQFGQHLHAQLGDPESGPLEPLWLRYLTSVYLPLRPIRQIGEDNYR